jgi:hypothetical protein
MTCALLLCSTVLGLAVPCLAADNATLPAADAAASKPAPPPKPAADPSKQQAKGEPQSPARKSSVTPDGTPAVVVDDNDVENLLGRDVKSAAGEKLGQITDILVSRSGAVRAAVIDFGGFLGVGTRKVAVAWETLRFSKDSIVVDMTRDELRVTPEYRQGEPIVVVGAANDHPSGPAAPAVKPPATK